MISRSVPINDVAEKHRGGLPHFATNATIGVQNAIPVRYIERARLWFFPTAGTANVKTTSRITGELFADWLCRRSLVRQRMAYNEGYSLTPVSFTEGMWMLVLSRKVGEKVNIGFDVVVTVIDIKRNRARLGIEGPSTVPIHRNEILARIREYSEPCGVKSLHAEDVHL